MLALRRAAVAVSSRRAMVGATRSYALGGRTEGTVAQSKGFSAKEKAHEDQYVHQHEAEQIRKLKDQIAARQAELNKLESEHDALHAAAEKK